jgi:hypothetical protein
MDISSVDLSKLSLVSSRSASARRSPRASISDPNAERINPVSQRVSDTVSKKLEGVSKVQQAFMFALRVGEDIQKHGILEPIM